MSVIDEALAHKRKLVLGESGLTTDIKSVKILILNIQKHLKSVHITQLRWIASNTCRKSDGGLSAIPSLSDKLVLEQGIQHKAEKL